MFNRRVLLSALAIIGLLAGGEIAVAKNRHHHDGHALLGAKLHQNGKHSVGKIGNNTVAAEVNNNKVTNMSAGTLPVRKVKSKNKMVSLQPHAVQVAASGEFKLAQVDAYYYGYCFDTPDGEECYWYPASDVVVTDGWVELRARLIRRGGEQRNLLAAKVNLGPLWAGVLVSG